MIPTSFARFPQFFDIKIMVLCAICLLFLTTTYAQTQLGGDIDGGAAGDLSGHSVSLSADGKRMAVGAPENGDIAPKAGQVRVYEWTGSAWGQLGAGINGDAEDDYFGRAVSLSADGKRLAVGAPYYDLPNIYTIGHVRVYEWTGSAWNQLGANINGEGSGDNSGYSVSLSADGKLVAIGAPRNSGTATSAGHVRVYEWTGSTWNKLGLDIDGEALGDFSGWSVSLSADGKRVAIGAPFQYRTAPPAGADGGHVRVYEWNGSAWSQLGVDIDGAAAGDNFGWSVSLSADGKRLAAGAIYNDGTGNPGHAAGHVRVFEWNGSAWNQLGVDIDGEDASDGWGFSVSLSSDGKRLAAGAPGNKGTASGAGHARIYEWNGSIWDQLGLDIDGEAQDNNSGWAVSLSSDGKSVAVGAPRNNGTAPSAGHVRVFSLNFAPICAIPAGFSNADIGNVSGTTGTACRDANGVYTVTTGGTGIKGLNDGFHFVSKSASGDIDLITRVTSIQNNASRQAGLMIRTGGAPDAASVSLVINGKKQIRLYRRPTNGGVTITAATKFAKKTPQNVAAPQL